MVMKINTNISSINAQKHLNRTEKDLSTPLQRLSSGKRINSAKDDAAGLAIVARMVSQISGSNVARRNANDGISLAQVAEGALSEASNMLQRVRELAVQSLNGTNSSSDRQALQQEASQLTSELNRLSGSTEFNGQKLLDGSFGTAAFQVGANTNQTIVATTSNFQTSQYGDQRIAGEASSVATTDRVTAAGSLDISGQSGSATVNYQAGDSAKAIAAQINTVSEQTSITASAATSVDLQFGSAGSYQLEITADNGSTQTVGFNLSAAGGSDALSQAVTSFNDKSVQTGVTASVSQNGTGITLTHSEGESIQVSDTTSANAGDVTVSSNGSSQVLTAANSTQDTAVATGQVTLDSNNSFTVAGTAGDVAATTSAASQLLSVSEVDISTVNQANNTLATIDAAIARVSAQRASYGALNNRFESTVRNLENYSENLSASRSRIEDTDYAKETAELTRSLILKDAGIAMAGHANASNQLVLGLLGKL
ncbi:MAG: flagellin [Gammaproteobacteria bacterium]|nr:flagellin [Gammaproteobacteria bacterium]